VLGARKKQKNKNKQHVARNLNCLR